MFPFKIIDFIVPALPQLFIALNRGPTAAHLKTLQISQQTQSA